MTHPAQFSTPILEALEKLLIWAPPSLLVFDPFAGAGKRLGRLCDQLDVRFGGIDIEDWPGHDQRVRRANAVDLTSYPREPFVVVTSPTYPNGMSDHFQPTEDSKRYTYRTSLGRALDPDNSGRYSIRGGQRAIDLYWCIVRSAVDCWARRRASVAVNVKDFIHEGNVYPLADKWVTLLEEYGYHVTNRMNVPTKGMRNGANRDARLKYEEIIVARHFGGT